jgi:glycosyltransferase involved in cell wall biosynthesis
MGETVTVAIPVLNGARYLDEVLAAVRAQEVDRDVEILVWDSGSTDGSLDIASRHGARIHQIPKSEFSHGGTPHRRRPDGWRHFWRALPLPKTSPRCSARTCRARTPVT